MSSFFGRQMWADRFPVPRHHRPSASWFPLRLNEAGRRLRAIAGRYLGAAQQDE